VSADAQRAEPQIGDGAFEDWSWPWFFAGVRRALAGPAFYVAISLMGVGSLARAAGFPVGVAALSTLLVWAGPGQLLFFGAALAKTAPPAIAFAVSLSSVRLLPMCLSVLPMLRGRQTRLPVLLTGSLPKPLGAGMMMLSPIYFLATTARSARSGADWLAILFGAVLAPVAIRFVGGGFDLPILALVGGGGAWLAGYIARRAS
jgi:predicted branched-subunit amino acid permease